VHKNDIGFKELIIPENSFLEGIMTDDLDLSKYGVLLIGLIDEERGHHFEFITAGINHKLDVGDTLVCIGSKEKLFSFSNEIKKMESFI